MPTMKSSREMAIASAQRKRPEPTPDDDSESSHSDFEQTTKPSSRATKKARTTNSNKNPPKSANSSTPSTTQPIKLPKAMTCPDSCSPFTKSHWKAIADTDEFWTYVQSMIPGHIWNKRFAVQIKTDVNAKVKEAREAKEARSARNRVGMPGAKKGGPIGLQYEARDGVRRDLVAEDNSDDDDEDGIGFGAAAGLTTKSDQEDAGDEKTTVAQSGLAVGSGWRRKAPSPGTLERIEEQKRIWAEFEAAKAKRETLEKSEEGRAVAAKDVSEKSLKDAGDGKRTLPVDSNGGGDSATTGAAVKRKSDEVIGKESVGVGNAVAKCSKMKAATNSTSGEMKGEWKPNGW